jgi:glyoxylase-like metal-dependent hydrolase (beta-lactamase superfamily II)
MFVCLSARVGIGSSLAQARRRAAWPTVIALAALALSNSAPAQDVDYNRTDFTTTQVGANLYVLRGSPNTDPGHKDGAGGRVSILVGADGVLMVDTSYAALHDKLKARISSLTHAPVRFIINTHEHPDHTGGNAAFAKEGAVVLAREEAREALAVVPPAAVVKANRNHIDFLDPQRLPVITYRSGSTLSLHVDDEIVDIIPLPSAHTNGDTAVRFERANVIMIGDVYRNYGYPFVDEALGGSIQGMLDAIDLLLHAAGPETVLIPGHGELIRRAELVTYRDMILDMRERVRSMIAAGQTREEIIAARPTSPYDGKVAGARSQLPAGFGISADRFVGSLYDELERGSAPRHSGG